jgi:1-aminocyclopropane-1-carboxylate deaminase/D-cysteine desulfhydrase-like pyridoxal-dependent ACC family enzyme
MICDKIPRTRLAYLPTPLEEAPRLSEALGGPRISIKRDDRSGLSFGGNKPRIFEYVFGDALQQGSDVMITPAGSQSNHLREVTAAANKLGLKSVIIVFGADGSEEPQGNLLLFRLLGAEIRYYRTEGDDDYHDPGLLEFAGQIKAEYEAQGFSPYIVHFSLHSGTLGSISHVNAAEELAGQFQAAGHTPDLLYVPCGSGVTASGFVLGLKHLGVPTRVVVASLIYSSGQITADLPGYANAAAETLGIATRVEAGDFDVLDCTPGGYGVVTPEVREAIELWAQNEGIFLDPTYNGKAMAAIIAQIRRGELTSGQSVTLIHTGGVPALFAQNRELAGE